MDYSFLVNTALFQGFTEEETKETLRRLQAAAVSYRKKEYIFRSGENTDRFGLVLSGIVQIENTDIWGGRSILDHAGPGTVFGETYACIPEEPMMVDVTAAEDCEILFLKAARLFETGRSGGCVQSRLVNNLLYVTAQKNLKLSRKNFHMSPKTIRGKLLSYLSFQAARQERLEFEIPFDRQQLADYLGVDRSAMSGELGRMRREGLLTCRKNWFCLSDAGRL